MSKDHDHEYRPRSPDLTGYTPQPPRLASYDSQSGFPVGYPLTHRLSYDASPYFSPQQSQPSSYFGQQPHGQYAPQTYSPQSDIFESHTQPPHSTQFPTHQLPKQRTPSSFSIPPAVFQSHGTMPRRRKVSEDEEDDYTPEVSVTSASGRGRKRKSDDAVDVSTTMPTGAGPSQGIEVKTKFPVARIKRIMQADEDVGKVAQATPTAVSKALELFMITLVTKAAGEAKDRSSKRITAAHLKQAVVKEDKLDFLQEIIEKAPDPTEKKLRGRSDSAEPTAEEGKVKRRGGGGGRRKKIESDH